MSYRALLRIGPRAARGWILGLLPLLAVAPAWGAIATDVVTWGDSSTPATNITSASFSTTSPNELLLAFVSTDGTAPGITVTGVTGAGLTWVLVRRTNAQLGTSEIWRAFAPGTLSNATVRADLSQSVSASIAVIGFTGVDVSGTNGSGAIGATGSGNANPGAPSATLVTTRNNSWVWGVGNDWDNPIPRVAGPNQTVVHYYLPPVGDTYWVQRQNAPTPASGTSVTINDTAPTTDRYNLSIVEVLPAAGPTFSLSGAILPPASGAGTLVTLSGGANATTNATGSGSYTFTGLLAGSYTVTPSKTGFTFGPVSQSVTIDATDVTSVDFTATAVPPPLNYPDLSDFIPASGISIVGSGTAREFQFTHQTFNGGNGPLQIQPAYRPASGHYQGTQHLYRFSQGAWTLVQQIPVAGAFVFHAEHGHFHFPYAAHGLYQVAADGGLGDPVVMSPKVGFCMSDSYIYDPTLPNAGALGNLGSCSDPTALRGLDIGAVDEYDKSDPGQSIPLNDVPDGTYWFRSVVDPQNYLAESNELNNETHVKVTITGSTVQVHETVVPVLSPHPTITLESPFDGAVITGTVDLTASTSTTTGVQYLVDGMPFGESVTTAPYTLAWNTTAVPNGSHWLAVETTDSNGRTNTSAVATVTVSNGPDTTPPMVRVTDPEAIAIVSASVAVSATAADASPVTSLQFYIDGNPLGTPLPSPPYIVFWNTRDVTNGPHTITATATDSVGLVGSSEPVNVAVDNSRPPELIAKEVTLSVDGNGLLLTPTFSTTEPNDLLVAFVAYNGPRTSPQTASVSGAGLTWLLLKRSNAQRGTSEIWAASAPGLLTNVTVASQPSSAGYSGSLTVIAFTHTSGPGVVGQASAPTGPPDVYLPGVQAGSWVFAVGNDWDNAIPRTPVAGQELVHQWLDTTSGDTYWVQSTTEPSTAHALVDIHDTAPTTDQWNYVAVEIVATRLSSVGVPQSDALPGAPALSGALPNPTSGGVTLALSLPGQHDVSMSVLDIQGRVVWASPSRRYAAGRWSLSWDGRGVRGLASPGVYFARINVGGKQFLRRFAVIR